MSVEGIWTSEILGLFGWETTGIVICENGRAIDGGNHHYSVGSYETSGDQIHIALSVEYHSTPRTISGASDKTLKVEINGTVENDIIDGQGSSCGPTGPESHVQTNSTHGPSRNLSTIDTLTN